METRLSSPTREVVISPQRPFVIIGERINPTGRSVLTAEMKAGVMDRVRTDALLQVQAGASVIDVNAGIPGADETELLVATIKAVRGVTDAPLCIDSSSIEALEAGLRVCEGKALVNSVDAETERMERILPLVKRYGAAVIGMTTDENGISPEPRGRLALAKRMVAAATNYGIPVQDVVIDPIAMPIGADPSSIEITLETMRLIRDELGNNMTCGASNVSFGLPNRASVNATFLTLAIRAGLTCAIANPLEPEVRRAIFDAV
ncbi:MAG TPA: dihydropteroate synthase [Candidatus Dormibacteraeota bacterium]|nr:dihydropteroate synthase [Candidatus Dormibacteraeota bacterium]